MRVKLQLVICHDDDHEETVTDVITLNKNNKRIEHLGLSLAESKQLLSTIQRQILQHQVTAFLDAHSTCPDCGTRLDLKARGSKSFRTLFGTFKFYSPRLKQCDCKRRKTASFRPLSALLTEPVAPELLYMEAKWSSLVSYGLSLNALQDFLPIDLSLDVKTVRYDTLKVAKRLEAELGENQASFIEGDPGDWDLLPPPEGSFKVGIDGGYVRNWFDKKHKFEVIVGKSILRFNESEEEDKTPSLKRFGFVQTLDTKSKRRLYEVLHSQDLQMNQDITFLSDGDDTLRQLQLEMSPKATHILDWHHVTMRLTVLGQYGKGLVQCEAVLGEQIQDKIDRLKWSLWHGQVDKALGKIDDLETSIEPFSETYARFPRLVKALSKLRTYIVNNRHLIPNYSERYHNGEPIATGFVESTVNEVVSRRFCKKQSMQWSKEGAHLLLQTRVRTLNGELAGIFKRWYPDLDIKAEEIPIAA
ncbi:MAG: ISKra4 family transposase [Candidatus Tectomicrobia bacterium]|nr:ISKra4 family transposase [Candidatus Tectomicrobia bacterium]